jgi:hypothetical protein
MTPHAHDPLRAMMLRVAFAGLTLLLWGGLVPPGAAQPAPSTGEGYFHEAAQHYLGEDLAAARRLVDEGLRVAPENAKLLALREKLQQRGPSPADSDSTSEGEAGQSETPSPESDAGSAPPQNEPGESGESEDSGEAGSQGASSSPAEGSPPEGPPDGDGRRSPSQAASPPSRSPQESQTPPEDASTAQREGRGGRPGGTTGASPSPSLSRAQAERILQALANQELQLLREVQRRPSQARSVTKDW